MDSPKSPTPQRQKQQTGEQHASRPEDSPVFNYIKSLSPINTVKFLHIGQTVHSLNFAALTSAFNSPHVNKRKETRFLTRYPLSELSGPELSSENWNGSDCSAPAPHDGNILCSLNEASAEPSAEYQTLPHDCSSPGHDTTFSDGVISDNKLVMGTTSLIEIVNDGLEENKNRPEAKFEMPISQHDGQTKVDAMQREWDNLGSVGGEDYLFFSKIMTTIESDAPTGHAQKFPDEDVNRSTLPPRFPVEAESAFQDVPVNCGEEIAKKNEREHTSHIFSSPRGKPGASVPCEKMDNQGGDGTTIGSKAVVNYHKLAMQRQSLLSKMAGTQRKSLYSYLRNSPSCSYSSHGNITDEYWKFSYFNSIPTLLPFGLPSIGWNLNSLASTSEDMRFLDPYASIDPFASPPYSIHPLPYIQAVQGSQRGSFPDKKDPISSDGGVEDFPALEDDRQALTVALGQNTSYNSLKKRKQRTENSSVGESCKRCNCKKSKCLKLYCECFATRVYCTEPCTCQGCLNKPMHEDTVLATRRQIESRNPLAFAPKVLKASEPTVEIGEEANNTPAFARHKRGCNCKKSSCLKKYCECYLSGVGCSISCRCEGCKNTYGRKYGSTSMKTDDTEQDVDSNEKYAVKQEKQLNVDVQNYIPQFPESVLPITPSFQVSRPFVHLPYPYSSKPPCSSTLSTGSTSRLTPTKAVGKFEDPPFQVRLNEHFEFVMEDETPEILRGDLPPICDVKVASRKRKRVLPSHSEAGDSSSWEGHLKSILKSIPSSTSLNCDSVDEFHDSFPEDFFKQDSPTG